MKLESTAEMDSNGTIEHEPSESLDTAFSDSSSSDDGSAAKKAKASFHGCECSKHASP